MAMLATVAGVAVALALGLDGDLTLFVPVFIAAAAMGALTRGRLNGTAINVAWVPAAVWFVGWALASIPEGMDHFMRTFIGSGYCGDFACAGQWFITSPLVGSLS
jgi:hypothetical protein